MHRANRCDKLNVLSSIPAKEKTKQMCVTAIREAMEPPHTKQLTNLFEAIPIHFLRQDLCYILVSKKLVKLEQLPWPTKRLFILALESGYRFCDLPKSFITEPMSMIAVTISGSNLEHVPIPWRSYKVCKVAVDNFPYAIEHTPTTLPEYKDLAYVAVKNRGVCLKHVDKKYWTDELIMLALCQKCKYGCALEVIPEDERHLEFCLAAVQHDNHAIQHVPKVWLTNPDIIKAMAKKCDDDFDVL